ncbi:solute carrier family 22 member 18 isoform X4 [Alligator mississippiensis]|uniref:solute carrier family 22 member 18 isoform X4 n=1 Tax=Alligator mississippiensis TaxID=8496 RepID=UPI0028775DAD|nr:solute carrier family 22 member 18 isoform X4 [Alligator mississippiensis]
MKEPTSEERNRNFREEALETHKPENMIQRQQVIRITYLITALDLTFLFMQTGIIPYLAKSLGLDSVDFGYLQTIFGVLQLLGGPVFGRCPDGRYRSDSSSSACRGIREAWPLFWGRNDHWILTGWNSCHKIWECWYYGCTSDFKGFSYYGLFLIMFSIISMDFFGLEAAESGYLLAYFGVLQMVIQGLVIGRLTSYYTERTLLMLGVVVFGGVGLALALMTNVFHYCIISLPMVFAFCTVGIITDSILTKAVPTSDTGYVRYSVITLLERKGEEAEGVSKHQANLSWSSKPCCSERRLPKKKSQLLCIQPSQKNIYNLDCSWIQLPTRFGAMLGICASVHPLMRTVGPTIGGLLYKQFGVSSFGYLQLAVNLVLFLYLSKNKIPPKEEKVQ